ncbi:TPA: phenylalanine--tRNA ligase subunit beta [candidate division CPR2 bacterium]|uniref:Phenylalanine--tRNA ligase beta subunit n=1 Tax=candidate division CPR2 bacterium GW2011_GWC1_41_48 TaxID=1618344 RepID=A0A0G0W7H8_UNCC2|nr:MAG: Phenylalanyl-tRNA ligase beta subunit PheT [candidate division CPR2 bacterium GW2011_GWC2_39_35]KKR27423.1 MAG: Phenylalanyl-tRNA ligase beta subunit PheT [candidate division CPR2 bacterium GW2011_GWD1_39_7]KKR28604.1 MAG: Phenylalanyl-tRNA ligase beta subunit PheT [candidate division CPR2 bacterium GW2011_GWD2_39_7]KKS08969.1 MAG: Phenylalanyl-tRNA ligase beta subunit PheT [candidate division CPR2 bacterium GW2011_GWC1_41_48]OGB58771.1 MAG: phenylalanine--tRNA ligase subunit beta [cand
MRVPIKWLKEYVKTDKSDKEIAELLSLSGTEIEKIENHAVTWSGVNVAEVLEIEKHPNADRLRLVTVNTGKDKQTVVCGAANVEVGQKIAFAREGAKLGDFELKRVNIRGVESAGMCASEAELGLSTESTGIMVLNASAKIGASLGEALEVGEPVLEAEITPNRSDEYSMIGIAREVAAVTGDELKFPEIDLKETEEKADSRINVEVLDKDLCSQYLARVIQIEKIGESPDWMKRHLEAAGVRPINLVVDVANYVMLELGQPLHAFDGDKIADQKIEVRRANDGEVLETLDGQKRKLDSSMLVIADAEKPIAIAGVMGGANSEISAKSKFAILESATFDKVSVRKTSSKLALRTEAVTRFEKGLPFKLAQIAIDRAAYLLQELGEGKVYSGTVAVKNYKDEEKVVELESEDVLKKLGLVLSIEEAIKYLNRLGFDAKSYDGIISATVPWWRLDVSIPEDLLEEIVRLYGLNNVEATLPRGDIPQPKVDKKLKIEFLLKDLLEGAGFTETLSYSFMSGESLEKIGFDQKRAIRVANPISGEHEYMRPSLIPSILQVIAKNEHDFDFIKIYELANIYLPSEEELPYESKGLVVAVSGIDDLRVIYPNGKTFYIAKGAAELILKELGINNIQFIPAKNDNFHPGRTAEIVVGEQKIGIIGEVHPALQHAFGLKRPVAILDLDFKLLVKLSNLIKPFKSLSSYPIVERDLSFIIDEKITFKEITESLAKTSPILKEIELLDVYLGLEEPGKISKTIRLYFEPTEKTLSEEEISGFVTKAMDVLKHKFGAVVRA